MDALTGPRPTRRAVLALLGATACVRGVPPRAAATPSGPVHLGWRWVPGARMAWRTRVERQVGDVTLVRAEDWAYVARELEPSGVVHLDGRLVGFGATVLVDGKAVPDEQVEAARSEVRESLTDAVQLGLRLSGRLVELSVEGFAPALPHRLLALHFPPDPVSPGDSWVDGGLARAFEPVLPLDVDVAVDASTTLTDVEAAADGWRASLTHATRLEVGRLGPALEVVGTSLWDTSPGALARREIEARWRPDAPQPTPVGVLRITQERLPDPDGP